MTDTSTNVCLPRDYRATVFLPATTFAMKAGLPQAEPLLLARWKAMDLYGRIRAQSKGRPLFVLHDGPPYANGEIHSGTGLNKILKDFVVRSQGMMGRDAPYVPGWDCHGLPIEWKIEERYRAQGKTKDDVPIDQLRRDCREFAMHWIGVQRAQFERLGCIGEWDKPYTTMDFRAEAAIAGELHKFVHNKLLYRGFRPVMWSPVEKTALAEAEVEYREKSSPAIYVKFPVVGGRAVLGDVCVVIWTTTPWTIPGNRAIAYSPDMQYGLYEIVETGEGAYGAPGERLALADVLADKVAAHARVQLKRLRDLDPAGLCSARIRSAAGDLISRCRSSPPATSPPRQEPVSCTPRPVMARRISSSAAATAWKFLAQSTKRESSTPTFRFSPPGAFSPPTARREMPMGR